jgi:hypothetical protein
MDKSSTSITHYTILIGINFYTAQPLRGCVNDVQATEKYLRNLPYPVHIDVLSATSPTDPHSCSPIEDPQQWPTYGNVKASFQNIISMVKPGDFVHIHYSGHGTRIEPSPANQYMGDVALVLLEWQNGNMIRYLRGVELAHIINTIVQNGVLVTLVLDCCFSGGVSREEDFNSIRSLSYSAEVDAAYPPLPEESVSVPTNNAGSRDGSMLPNWLINPDKYTILAACGPHEVAREIGLRDGNRHGALSYLLLDTLSQTANSVKTSQEIYQNLCAIFRKDCPRQNPVLYGNADLSFFGPFVSGPIASFTVSSQQSSGIRLEGGQAHGVCVGDLFTLQPFSSENTGAVNSSDDPITSRVVQTYALSSDLELTNRAVGEVSVSVGWTAKVLSRVALQKYPILISVPLTDLDQWRQAAKNRSSLFVLTEDSEGDFSFYVTLDENDNCQIKDESNAVIPNLPFIARSRESAVDELLDILEHLARFKHVKAITNLNPVASFRNSFHVHMIKPSGERFQADQIIDVHHGDQVTIDLQNNSNRPLYFHIYNLAPGWEIEHIFKGSYLTVSPVDPDNHFSGNAQRKIRMTLPQHLLAKGLTECMDIIKIFVTARPTTFDTLEMPRIDASGKMDSSASSAVQVVPGGTDNESPEDWLALNFQFHTSLRQQ